MAYHSSRVLVPLFRYIPVARSGNPISGCLLLGNPGIGYKYLLDLPPLSVGTFCLQVELVLVVVQVVVQVWKYKFVLIFFAQFLTSKEFRGY